MHQAPAFGEDDYRVCMAHGIVAKGASVPCPVDAAGRFTAEVTDFAGVHVKEADKAIVAKLKEAGRLVDNSTVVHSYPFCWRSDTPLIYKVRALRSPQAIVGNNGGISDQMKCGLVLCDLILSL